MVHCFQPAEDGMAKAFALLTAQEAAAMNTRIDDIADTVCPGDERTTAQRRADGLCALIAGYRTLGCRCVNPDCRKHEKIAHNTPDADGVITCPLHGLRIRAADGVVLTATPAAALAIGA